MEISLNSHNFQTMNRHFHLMAALFRLSLSMKIERMMHWALSDNGRKNSFIEKNKILSHYFLWKAMNQFRSRAIDNNANEEAFHYSSYSVGPTPYKYAMQSRLWNSRTENIVMFSIVTERCDSDNSNSVWIIHLSGRGSSNSGADGSEALQVPSGEIEWFIHQNCKRL